MRIALIVHGFPPHEFTGVENHVAALAREFARRGQDVHVLAPRRDARTPAFALRREARDGYVVHWLTEPCAPRSAEEHLDRPGMAASFAEFQERVRPDVVHFHHAQKLGLGMLEEAARGEHPVLYTAHDYYAICHRTILARPDLAPCASRADPQACARCDAAASYLNGLGRWSDWQAGVLPTSLASGERAELARILAVPAEAHSPARARLDARRQAAFDALDLVLAPTESLRAELVAAGFDPARVERSEYGIETAELAALPAPNDGTRAPLAFGFVGGASKHKGLHVLLEAFAGLAGRARLVIHGDSTDREHVAALRERAHAVGAEWRGAFAAGERAAAFGAFDVLVVPSIWRENAPFVIREAFAARRPVVASDTPALAESVRADVDGLLVPPGDARALRAALERLIAEPGLAARLARGTREPRTLAVEAGLLLERYAALLARRSTAAEHRVPESARGFAARVAALERLSLAELEQQASAGLALLAADLGVEPSNASPADAREAALDRLDDARRELRWRAQRELHDAGELAAARLELDSARLELAARGAALEEAARAQRDARAALAQAVAALDSARDHGGRLEAVLRALREERESLAGELARARLGEEAACSRAAASEAERAALLAVHADLTAAHVALTAEAARLAHHARWLERESAALARRFGSAADTLATGADFSAALAALERFERELAWRRTEMRAARREGGRLLRALVQRSGLGRRMRDWGDEP